MSRRNGLWVGVSLGLVVLAIAMPAFAQYTTSGAVFGKVTEPDGKPIPGVVVTLKSPLLVNPLVATSDANGGYRFGDIVPGAYMLSAALSGFVTTEVEQVTVRVGSALRLDIEMGQAKGVKEQVSVTAAAPQIESVKSQINKYVSFNEIQNLPLQNRNFLDVLRTVPGVLTGVPTGTYIDRGPRNSFNIHGARDNDNDFLLDGASNNDKSDLNYEDIASVNILGGPRSGNAGRAGQTFQVGTALQTYNLDAIQEVQVSTSMFSAEFGSGGSGGVINVITRSGADFLAGSATFQYQKDAWVKGSTQSIYYPSAALVLGGPFVKGQTHFFATYQHQDEKLGFDFSQPSYYVPNYLRNPNSKRTANETIRDSFTFKLSQTFNPSHTLAATLNPINERADVLQTIFRDRSINDAVNEHYENKSIGLIVRDLAVLRENWVLESVFNTTGVDRNFDSSTDAPREIFNFYIPSYHSYTIGTNSPDTTNTIQTFGWSEKLSVMGSKTSSKFGVGVDYFKQHSKQIEYLSLYHYPEDGTTSYLRQPPTDLTASVTDISAFAQTDWFLNPKTTLNLGLRLGHDNLVGETTFEPRVGLAYDPQGNGRQVIRAGVGIYHDRSNLIGQTGALRPPIDFGDVIDGTLVPSDFPSLTVVDPDLKLPTIYKAVLGYQRQVGQNTTAGVTVFANWSRDLFFVGTLNRADAEGNRPDPTKGDISLYSNYGKSDVYDAELEFRHTFKNGSMVQASYTYEHTRGNSSFDFLSGNDDLNRGTYVAGQMQAYEVWGPLNFDSEHTLKASGVFMLPWGFQFSTFIQWNTGQPYFWYTTWYELPAYFPHFDFYGGGFNSQRLDSQFNADVRLAKSFKIGNTDLLFFFDGFNITDRKNVLQRNGLYAYNYGSPIGSAGTVYYAKYNQPIFYGPRRSAQLGVRFSF